MLTYVCDYKKYRVFRNAEGFLELFKTKGKNAKEAQERVVIDGQIMGKNGIVNGDDTDRIVTMAVTLDDLKPYITKRRTKGYNPDNPSQLRIA